MAAGQNSADLAVTGLTLNGATIDDAVGNAADLSGAATSLSGTLQIDTTAPTASSLASSLTGEGAVGQTVHLTLTMSEALSLNLTGGSPTLSLSDGATATYDASASNPSAGSLAFDYTIGGSDHSANVEVVSVNVPSATTIADGAGNLANFAGALDVGTGLQVGTAKQIIDGYLQAVEQRAPLTGEDTTYINEINSGADTYTQVLHQIVNDGYATKDVVPVALMYNAVYGRVPDAGGLAFWTNSYSIWLQTVPETPGSTVNEAMVTLAEQFVSAAEFASRYGGSDPSTDTYTTLLYTNVLNRTPDQGGLTYWEGVLNSLETSGVNHTVARAELLEQFVDSAEYVNSASPNARGFLEQEALGTQTFAGTLWQQPTDAAVEASQTTTLDLTGNTATASVTGFVSMGSGVGEATSLSLGSGYETIGLGSEAATLDYALGAADGVYSVAGFNAAYDVLSVALNGGCLEQTLVNGGDWISSSSNLTHGVFLTGMTSAQKAR